MIDDVYIMCTNDTASVSTSKTNSYFDFKNGSDPPSSGCSVGGVRFWAQILLVLCMLPECANNLSTFKLLPSAVSASL